MSDFTPGDFVEIRRPSVPADDDPAAIVIEDLGERGVYVVPGASGLARSLVPREWIKASPLNAGSDFFSGLGGKRETRASDVTVRVDDGEVIIEALGGRSFSCVKITDEYTAWTIGSTTLRCGSRDMRLQVDGKTVYEESW